jgi:GNAT superfamily N-acetyltransferase
MGYEFFSHADIPAFLEMAAVEGWISSEWELKFLLHNFPSGCFVLREGDMPVAFVTSIKYDKSGWIGNLIVKESLRGRGLGTALMKKALDALRSAGTDTVWLTASPAGRPVYERLGFAEIDVINRWKGKGGGGCADHICDISPEEARRLDGLCWDDRRTVLVDAARMRGEMLGVKDGFIIIQDCGKFRQAGPWACTGEKIARLLLDMALSVVDKSTEVVVDTPGKNIAVDMLLSSRDFKCVGRTCLMYTGAEPVYNPRGIYALGSMGSMG